MQCPKCSTTMHLSHDVGFGNSFDRESAGSTHVGWKCHNCARWIEPDIASSPIPPIAERPFKEFCVHGHARTPDNLDKKGACKTCQRIKDVHRTRDPAYKSYQRKYRGIVGKSQEVNNG